GGRPRSRAPAFLFSPGSVTLSAMEGMMPEQTRPVPFYTLRVECCSARQLLDERERIQSTDLLTEPAKKLEIMLIDRRLKQIGRATV
ncbi:MAG: hypothetical protein ACM3KM_01320, partial [Acidobacteriaceae bacterium]